MPSVVSRGGGVAAQGERGEIIAGFRAAGADAAAGSHVNPGIRRCKLCGIRKVLDRGFYRDKTCRGGYRQVCKKCRNRERAEWARARYVPKTGRRYRAKADRAP